MPQISITVSSQKVVQSLTNLGQAMPGLVNADIEAVLEQTRAELAQPGSPSVSPVLWDSEKQRRAYFATDGFGHGIPYVRTGAYEQGFVVQKTGSNTYRQYKIVNKQSAAKYVGGDAMGGSQSRIHRGRWPLMFQVVRDKAVQLLSAAQDAVHSAIRDSGIGL